jgi:SCY1-like protein 2
MFALGCVAFAVFNKGRPLLARESDAQASTRNLHKVCFLITYQIDLHIHISTPPFQLKQLSSAQLSVVPEGLRDYVKMLLNIKPELRPDAHQFTQVRWELKPFLWNIMSYVFQIEYFQDVGVKTLNYLDSLFQWDNLQKSQFYKGLPQILPQFPHRVCLLR